MIEDLREIGRSIIVASLIYIILIILTQNYVVKGKSMYVSSKKKKFFCSSIAGGIIPIALGIALAIKKSRKNIHKTSSPALGMKNRTKIIS